MIRTFTHFGSPIYTLILGTRTYVILSSDAAVRDLLDKRSNIYSSRPDMYMGQEVASGGLRLVTMVKPSQSTKRLKHGRFI